MNTVFWTNNQKKFFKSVNCKAEMISWKKKVGNKKRYDMSNIGSWSVEKKSWSILNRSSHLEFKYIFSLKLYMMTIYLTVLLFSWFLHITWKLEQASCIQIDGPTKIMFIIIFYLYLYFIYI